MQSEKVVICSPVSSDGECMFHLVFPSPTRISSAVNYKILSMKYSISGTKDFNKFDHDVLFPIGDYNFLFALEMKEDAAIKKESLYIIVEHEEISNFTMYQALAGLYNCVGYEISHILNFPMKTVDSTVVPIYKKVRIDINNLSKHLIEELLKTSEMHVESILLNIKEIAEKKEPGIDVLKINQVMDSLEQMKEVSASIKRISTHMEELRRLMKEMESGKRSVSLDEIEKMVEDKNMYYSKLIEAENYIEANIEHRRGTFVAH